MRYIHIMSGIPASGKSTFIERNCDDDEQVFHRDEFRDYLRSALKTDKYFPLPAAQEWQYWTGLLNGFLIMSPNIDLWIDQTTLGAGALTKLLSSLFLTANDNIIIHILDVPFETCLSRNAQREDFIQVPTKTMLSMNESMEDWLYTHKHYQFTTPATITFEINN